MSTPIIMCIDDEQIILNTLYTQLDNKYGQNFTVEVAESAEEALQLIEKLLRKGRTIAMIITDQIMPGLKGDELLVQLHTTMPQTIKILLTGQAGLESAINAINNADLFRYLTKPWQATDLLLTVDKGLHQYTLIETLENQVRTFKRFVPEQFMQRIAKHGLQHIDQGVGVKESLSVLFCDIRGFTRLSEEMEANRLFTFLNDYFEEMDEEIISHAGFIDKFIGDAIMALFDNVDPRQCALNSVQAAHGMIRNARSSNPSRIVKGLPEIKIGIGIHFGEVMIGTVGSKNRIESTVIGDAVNLASRIESLTKYYQIPLIVSESIYKMLEKDSTLLFRFIDLVTVEGKSIPIKIYEIFNVDEVNIREMKLATASDYNKGVEFFQSRHWKLALDCFTACLSQLPDDNVCQRYQKRCEDFLLNPPDESWDGALQMRQK